MCVCPAFSFYFSCGFRVPPNCSFEVDDIEMEWAWTKSFDFIFSRTMAGSFTDHQTHVKNAFKCVFIPHHRPESATKTASSALEPGGYLEAHEIDPNMGCEDGTLTEENDLLRLNKQLIQASVKMGRTLDVARNYKSYLENAGFVGIVERTYKWPLGTWPKDTYYRKLGFYYFDNINRGLEGIVTAMLTRELGMSLEDEENRSTRVFDSVSLYVSRYGKELTCVLGTWCMTESQMCQIERQVVRIWGVGW
jgi:hypothetical protein